VFRKEHENENGMDNLLAAGFLASAHTTRNVSLIVARKENLVFLYRTANRSAKLRRIE
jgi:hypothetical protein